MVHYKYSTALANSDLVTLGHLPKFMSKLVRVFIKYAGNISFDVIISKRYSTNLEQGSLGVPGKITFCNSNEKIIEGIKEAWSSYRGSSKKT